jgi:hypothetical protein
LVENLSNEKVAFSGRCKFDFCCEIVIKETSSRVNELCFEMDVTGMVLVGTS